MEQQVIKEGAAASSESAPLMGIRLPGVLGRIPEHCKVMACGTCYNK